MKLSLKKVRLEDDGEFFLYSRYEIGKNFHINLFNTKNSEAYDGDISEINLRAMASARRTTYTDFLANTLCALMWDDASDVQFSYNFEKDSESLYFRWAKVFESEDMKVSLGRIKVARVEFCSLIETVLCQVSTELHSISSSLEKAKLELEESNKEKEMSKELVQSAIKVKKDMEKELYSKFVIVLNKKKEKIRKLKQEVAASTPESISDNEAVVTKGKKRTKKMPLKNQSKRVLPHVMSTSEDDASECSDEDLFSKPGPSSCHRPTSNSLLLEDDDDIEFICTVQQPRQRHPKGSYKRDAVPDEENKNKDDSHSPQERNEETRVSDDSIENLLHML